MSTQKNKNLISEPSREKIFPANPRYFDSRYDSTGIVRQELKFPGKSTFNFRITLNEWGMKPSFPDRKVFSIYFDSVNLDLFRISEEGLTPRRKIRLRWYDKPKNIVNSTLEIKTTKEHEKTKDKFNISNTDPESPQKFIRSLTTLNLVPICQVQYHRAYLENRDGARATIDSRICYSRVTNQFKIIEPFFFDSYNILELKTTNPTLSQTLAGEHHLPMERFSKYCKSIEKIFNF